MEQKYKDLLIKHEGLRLKPYLCTAGKLTIGVGRNLDDRGLTKDECLYLLDNDIKEAHDSLSNELFYCKLNEARQSVLINMYVNLGPVGLRKFKLFLFCLASGRFEDASKEMLKSKWATQVGSRAKELSEIIKNGF